MLVAMAVSAPADDARVFQCRGISEIVAGPIAINTAAGRRRTAEILQEALHLLARFPGPPSLRARAHSDCIIGRPWV